VGRLFRVQQLEGDGPPFERLAKFLRAGQFAAAAIDAPFSVPSSFVPSAGHTELLTLVGALPNGARPFPRGADFVAAVTRSSASLTPPKPLRTTERHWQRRGVNVRSTLWAGHRGGAPFASACLRLLNMAGRPLWPWSTTSGTLVEAFPAAQLRQWNLPHNAYSDAGSSARAARELIVAKLSSLVVLDDFHETILDSTDALDATIAAFAAVAVSNDAVAHPPDRAFAGSEGWIAVHR
jgi:hypothetical protein